MADSTAPFHVSASTWLDSGRAVLEAVAAWIERRQFVVVGVFSAFFFAFNLAVAHRKLFWFDELFTYYLSSLPSVGEILSELAKGVDYHPPAYFLMMRAASTLWPDPQVSFRIPSIVGLWLLSVCLFRFVTRRTSAVYGTLAMLAPFITAGRTWVTDARPYGPAAGLLALGFVAWQSATISPRRAGSLALLAVAIAGAISMSYYAVLALVPLGIAELVRTAERRRIDFPVWLAMFSGVSICFLYLPAVRRGVGQFVADGWARPKLGTLLTIYQDLFQSTIPFWLGGLLLVGLLVILQRGTRQPSDRLDFALPAADLALAAGLLLLPGLGVAVAYLVTKMITARYVISTVTGFSMLLALIAFRAARANAVTGLLITGVVLANSLITWHIEWNTAPSRGGDIEDVSVLLKRAPADTASLPVVFESPLQFFPIVHYSDRTFAGRFVFLIDADSSRSYSGVRYTGLGLTSMQRYAPLHIEQYASFRKAHSRFLLYETSFVGEYVLPKLIDEGAVLRLLGRRRDSYLYLVD